MIAFKGRLSFRQYMPAKPTKYSIKIWMTADSQNGYVKNFSVYLGKEANVPSVNGLGYDVALKMASPFLKKHRHIFFNNFFASTKLMEDLLAQDTYACGTVRSNRKKLPPYVAGGKSLRSARQNNFYQMARQKRHFVLVHKCFA